MPKYILELSEEQAGALQIACEVGARIGMYQLHDVCRLLPSKTKRQHEIYDVVYKALWDMYLEYTRGSTDDRELAEITSVLLDLYQVIRYRLSWDRHPEGDTMSVMFDTPLRRAKCDLAKITQAKGLQDESHRG